MVSREHDEGCLSFLGVTVTFRASKTKAMGGLSVLGDLKLPKNLPKSKVAQDAAEEVDDSCLKQGLLVLE